MAMIVSKNFIASAFGRWKECWSWFRDCRWCSDSEFLVHDRPCRSSAGSNTNWLGTYRCSLQVPFGVPHIVGAADDEGHSLMQLLGLNVENAHGPRTGPAAGLFYDHRHGIGLIKQP